ncbi:MAG TPA: hypothetical protein VN476_11765, partial [Pyrinomonadaceae bacterium]|nr:hypothetical protein [Pyrinomonadaceae bacterium]
DQVTNYGDVVIGSDVGVAPGTFGRWEYDRLLKRDAMNDDVEEAADNGSEDPHERAGDGQWHIDGVLCRR